ncbi:hypothetical protein QR680_016525 [Steinernema hermaphroditum]|uniref:Uncharacterized protein n=1 Tax=Steinernema hermaphroditum TaxID=289476 RepID=A0AA39HDG8_9BILA|nr:hypothetical protein QR680_016525 [Steinernema hermaphroditum]
MPSSEEIETLFNRILDASAAINFPMKLLCMYVIYRHSPKEMGALPIFILNIFFWNLLGNVFGAILHIIPQFPSHCYRADGPVQLLTKNEYVYHYFFAGTFTCITNCGLAMSFAFPYRYLVFVHPELVKKVKMKWGIAFCITLHTLYCITFIYNYSSAVLSYDDYPWKEELPVPGRVFCYWPYGWRKNIVQVIFFIFTTISVLMVSVFSVMLLRSLMKVRETLGLETIDIHRKYLVYLMIITAVPLIFGGIPVLICNVCALFPHIQYCKEVSMICIVILYNHGALYSVVSIVTFKPYLNAVKRMVTRVFHSEHHTQVLIFVSH